MAQGVLTQSPVKQQPDVVHRVHNSPTPVAWLLIGVAALSDLGCTGSIVLGANATEAGNPSGPQSTALLPPRIRRLTRLEYDASVAALLGTSQKLGASFPAELRQSGFTRNEAQVVDATFALAAQQAADALAAEAVTQRLSTLAPCSQGQAPDACAKNFISRFGARAYRRPLTADEADGLLAVYQVGAEDGFAAGVQLVVSAVLQSAGFLYSTEIGSGGSGPTTLTPWETATQLAFLFSGAPPDDELLAAAADGSLHDSAVRKAQALRLLGQPGAHTQVQTLVMEWLSLDKLNNLSKDNALYPHFAERRGAMLAEARDFTDEVFFAKGGDVQLLLNADFTVASGDLTALYGLSGSGHVSLASTNRRGILGQSAFLSAFSNVSDSGPVHRGVAVMRQLACTHIPNPSELKIQVVPPPADPTRTTRQRFARHSSDPACAGCHTLIDGPGFSFEHFNAEAAYRAQDNNQAVDASGQIVLDGETHAFQDNVELSAALASSQQVTECFARNLHRFASAQTDDSVEERFLSFWRSLPAGARGKPSDVLAAWAASDTFVQRGQP